MNKVWGKVKAFLAPPGAIVLAARELEEAKRQLLSAQSGREYADGMVKYYETKIKRLTAYLKNTEEA